MRRISLLCAAAGIALTALAAASPAQAGFHLIRWQGTGFCQIWVEAVPTRPFPSDYRTVSRSVPTFIEAMAVKETLLRRHTCTF
jgi:hypothetical protein